MNSLGPSDWLWKEGADYYTHTEAELIANPCLPNPRFLRDLRMLKVLREEGGVAPGVEVLEIGCGRSSWLAYLACEGCHVSGIEMEPHAARLAKANLAGAGTSGHIFCGDAFDLEQHQALRGRYDVLYSVGFVEHFDRVSDKLRLLGSYLKPRGRIVSFVPNLQGINWFMQRFGSLPVLQAHVIYTTHTLRKVHEEAGYQTVLTKYLGFCDGFLTNSAGQISPLKHRMHHAMCRALGLCSAGWYRTGLPTPEWRWMSPLVVYVGVQPAVSSDIQDGPESTRYPSR